MTYSYQVYDISKPFDQQGINEWLGEVRRYCPDIDVTLVGNKYDLRHLRMVTKELGVNFAANNDMRFIETSALDSHNVEKAFHDLVERILAKRLLLQQQNELEDFRRRQLQRYLIRYSDYEYADMCYITYGIKNHLLAEAQSNWTIHVRRKRPANGAK